MRRQSILGYLPSFELLFSCGVGSGESLPEAFHCWCIVSYIGSPQLIVVEVERFFVVLLLFAHSCSTGNCKASASLFLGVNRTDSLNR